MKKAATTTKGRRCMKKVTVNGTVASHARYLYRGYLQIAALDMLNSRNVLRTLLWDPGTDCHPPARSGAGCLSLLLWMGLQQECDGGVRWAGNCCGGLRLLSHGQVASTGDLVQPVQWSSEMNDAELSLIYYNYRYYNPADGRWINRIPSLKKGDGIFMGSSEIIL